jgi:hypothetical protein
MPLTLLIGRPPVCAWDTKPAQSHQEDVPASTDSGRHGRLTGLVLLLRHIKPGTLADFERAWRPGTHPEGMLRAYAYWSADEREIVGVSFWVSKESCEAWRAPGRGGAAA